jgi:DNA-binding NtrC family response regulator
MRAVSVAALPRVLILDDLYGRSLSPGANVERQQLCGHLLLDDVTGDQDQRSAYAITSPVAKAVFCRAQRPQRSTVGDRVENDLNAALAAVEAGWKPTVAPNDRWALVLVDLSFVTGLVTVESDARTRGMPGGTPDPPDEAGHYFGLVILRAIRERWPELPVAILSSMPREEVSREFSKLGAVGFLSKTALDGADRLNDFLWRHGLMPDASGQIVGSSLRLLLSLRAARRAASSDRHVLIRGERGSGKELFARFIHQQRSQVRTRPLVVVDSGSLSGSLYAATLFGHTRGAFTGATHDRPGTIVQAHGGDLFLDEVGNMPSDVQMGLLRMLATREVVPLGASTGRIVDVRVLSATNENLEAKAASGAFRDDLLDRLKAGGAIEVPPLRERSDDLPAIAISLVRKAERDLGARARDIDPDALALLMQRQWPGNVRELESCLHEAVRAYPDVEHLVPEHLATGTPASWSPRPSSPVSSAVDSPPDRRDLSHLLSQLHAFGATNDASPVDVAGALPALQAAWAEVLGRVMRAALVHTRRWSPDNPAGEVLIHPAMKLVTGDPGLTASKAADIVKRILSSHPRLEELLASDEILRAAWTKAIRLRPRLTRGADSKSL